MNSRIWLIECPGRSVSIVRSKCIGIRIVHSRAAGFLKSRNPASLRRAGVYTPGIGAKVSQRTYCPEPRRTLAVRVAGDSMTSAGIFQGDIAVVNRAVLALLDGEFTIKCYRQRNVI